jgi:hypothetical protein
LIELVNAALGCIYDLEVENKEEADVGVEWLADDEDGMKMGWPVNTLPG